MANSTVSRETAEHDLGRVKENGESEIVFRGFARHTAYVSRDVRTYRLTEVLPWPCPFSCTGSIQGAYPLVACDDEKAGDGRYPTRIDHRMAKAYASPKRDEILSQRCSGKLSKHLDMLSSALTTRMSAADHYWVKRALAYQLILVKLFVHVRVDEK